MKLFSLFLLFFIPFNLFAQQKLNKLSVNPIQLFGYNRLNIEYERGFIEGKFGIGFYLGSTGNSSRKIHGQYSKLSEQNFSIKFYPQKADKSGFSYGALVSIASGNVYDENGLDSATNIGTLGVFATGAYQFIYKSFYTNVYLNAGYALSNDLFGNAKYTGNIGKPTDWLLTYGLKIGLCF